MITNEDWAIEAQRLALNVNLLLSEAFKGAHNYHPSLLGLALAHHIHDGAYKGPIRTLAREAAQVWRGTPPRDSANRGFTQICENIRDAIKFRLDRMEKLNVNT
jgi:hypothetical protein